MNALLSTEKRLHLQDARIKPRAGIVAATHLVEQLAVFDKQHAVGVRCRKSIVRHHHDGRVQFGIQKFEGFE